MKTKWRFSKDINGLAPGIVDVGCDPPKVICMCREEDAKIIISIKQKADSYDELSDGIYKLYEEYAEDGLIAVGELAASHFGLL